jgi:hypothetical protein
MFKLVYKIHIQFGNPGLVRQTQILYIATVYPCHFWAPGPKNDIGKLPSFSFFREKRLSQGSNQGSSQDANYATSSANHPPSSMTCVCFAEPSSPGVTGPFLTQKTPFLLKVLEKGSKNGRPLVERTFLHEKRPSNARGRGLCEANAGHAHRRMVC